MNVVTTASTGEKHLWKAHGYSGYGNVASLIDSLKSQTAVVCGNGAGVFDELELVKRKYDNFVVFAVNDVGMFLPQVDHWVSYHNKFEPWESVRKLNYEKKYKTHTLGYYADYIWTGLDPNFLLSGYFAVQIAHIMGCELIILCGCPGSTSKRFFEAHPRPDFSYGSGQSQSDYDVRRQFVSEMSRVAGLQSKLRSMSGWTRSYLGGI